MPRCYKNPASDAWYLTLKEAPARVPFSFIYDGNKYEGFSPEHFALLSCETFQKKDCETTLFRWKLDCLTVSLKLSHYYNHGVTEWTVWFANESDRESALLEDAKTVLAFSGGHPELKGILGDHVNQYRPYSYDLRSMPVTFESNTGRATHVNFPYFNLEHGDGGTMIAIGWAGTWRADFRAVGEETRCTLKSVNGMRTKLKPGETIRTALFVCADYTIRDESYAANYWRSWFIESNLPAADGKGTPLEPFITAGLASDTGLPNSDGSISERWFTWRPSMEKMLAEGVQPNFRWFDAGWYVAPDGSSPETDWWGTVGTWTMDKLKWPADSFRQSTDFARAHGMKTLMWFEPERVTDVDNLVKNFGYRPEWAIRQPGNRAIPNNIGDPDCFAWTLDKIKTTLTENRVEMFREDNNSNPGPTWSYMDSLEGPDRKGITECKFVDAHYCLWDEIIACTTGYGGCGFVDSCASGGGRNDLESMRRGIPLLRSDSDRTTTSLRLSMTTAFNKWIPFCGSNNKEKLSELAPTGVLDHYVWRCSYLPALNVDSQYIQDPDQDFDMLRFGLNEWKKLKPYMLKEMYVHTPWHTEKEKTGFTAYSYFDPDAKKGVLLAFRQESCIEENLALTLPYVGAGESITLTDEDSGEIISVSGAVMKAAGFTLTFDQPRTARVLWVSIE